MKAKELKQRSAVYMTGFEGDPVLWRYQFKEVEFQAFYEQLCREQREICAGQFNNQAIRDKVINAPIPEL